MTTTREDLGAWVRVQIERARISAPHLVHDYKDALQVWGTIGSVGYLTVAGEARLARDVGPEPGTFETFTGPDAFRTVLFFGSRHHPELLRWLPSRAPDDPTCTRCAGTGTFPLPPHPTCDACQGYGWVARSPAAPG
jgi:hypothetical protein